MPVCCFHFWFICIYSSTILRTKSKAYNVKTGFSKLFLKACRKYNAAKSALLSLLHLHLNFYNHSFFTTFQGYILYFFKVIVFKDAVYNINFFFFFLHMAYFSLFFREEARNRRAHLISLNAVSFLCAFTCYPLWA